MERTKTVAWWYWLVTVAFLVVAVTGNPLGLYAAVSLCSVQVFHYGVRHRSVAAFPVQVRIAYLGLLLLSQAPGGQIILWVQLLGTTAMVTVNYCLLARVLSLMPWNRDAPLTKDVIISTLFSAPVAGSVQEKGQGSAAVESINRL